MAIDNFGIRVLARDGAVVTLQVCALNGYHYDIPCPAHREFFMMVANSWDVPPDGAAAWREITDDGDDAAAMFDASPDAIRDVEVLEIGNTLVPTELEHIGEDARDGWVDEHRLVRAVYRVTFTNPALVAHFQPGQRISTAAYWESQLPRVDDSPSGPWIARARGVGRDAPAAALATLAPALRHRDGEVVSAALEAFARAGPRAAPWSARIARVADMTGLRKGALAALGAIGDATSVGTLAIECSFGDPLPAFRALARVGRRALVAAQPLREYVYTSRAGIWRGPAAVALYAVTGQLADWTPVTDALGSRRKRRGATFDVLCALDDAAIPGAAHALRPLFESEAAIAYWTEALELVRRGRAAEMAEALRRFARAQRERPAYAELALEVAREVTGGSS